MEDKRFLVFCGLLTFWLLLFFSALCGEKVNPKFEEFMAVVCVGWFVYWTLYLIKTNYNKNNTQSTEQNENENGKDKPSESI